MAWLHRIVFGAALAAGAAACGYPTFQYGTSTNTGGTGGTGGSGGASTSSSATTSSSSSSSSSSSTTSSTSSSTGGPTPCTALDDVADCGANMRCAVVDTDKGTLGCVPIGSPTKKPYEACLDDTLCPAGTFCDQRTYTCMKLCNGAASCPGKCVAAEADGGVTVPGISVCTARCNPASTTSCGPNAVCAYDSTAIDFDCFARSGFLGTMDKLPGETCMYLNNCPPSYVCAGACVKWCHPVDDFSSECGGGFCNAFSNATPIYMGNEYGYCD